MRVSLRPETAQYGHVLRPLWQLDPYIAPINHGSFGATPIEILEEQTHWQGVMEKNPARFFMQDLPRELRRTAAEIAPYFGTSPGRFAFVENATSGTTAVLRSLEFAPGDEILTTDHVYNAVRNTISFIAIRTGAVSIEVPMPAPLQHGAEATEVILAAMSPRTRLVVLDHISSTSTATFPVKQIVAACHSRGVPVLIDGAHGPGLLDLDIDDIGADWYVGNCHKWLCAPKGAAFIVVSERPTSLVHPLAISHAYGQGFVAEFDKTGTRDASPWLCIPAAIRFHERLGGKSMRQRNKKLALRVAQAMTQETGMTAACAPELCQSMVALKLPVDRVPTREDIGSIHDFLYDHHRFETAITILRGAVYLRISVHAYNEASDFDGLAKAAMAAAEALV